MFSWNTFSSGSRKTYRAITSSQTTEIPLGGYIPGKMGTLAIYDNGKLSHKIKYVITDSFDRSPILDHFADCRVNSGCETVCFTADAHIVARSFGSHLNENSDVVQFEFPDTDECYLFRFSELPVLTKRPKIAPTQPAGATDAV